MENLIGFLQERKIKMEFHTEIDMEIIISYHHMKKLGILRINLFLHYQNQYR